MKQHITYDRRRELDRIERRLESLALKRGERIVAERFGYNPLKSVRITGTISGERMA